MTGDLRPILLFPPMAAQRNDDERRVQGRERINFDLSASEFRERFRFSAAEVETILSDIGHRLKNRRNTDNGLQPHHRFLVALRFFATGFFFLLRRRRPWNFEGFRPCMCSASNYSTRRKVFSTNCIVASSGRGKTSNRKRLLPEGTFPSSVVLLMEHLSPSQLHQKTNGNSLTARVDIL